jgi:glycosyltransferase involved in cell wall biosynthesis
LEPPAEGGGVPRFVYIRLGGPGDGHLSPQPEISVIVSTFQRPDHLRRSLLSLALQRGVDVPFEIVVTDDGSIDHTAEVVHRFATTVDFPLQFVTQDHRGFHAARCRNHGAQAARASYLIFFDGDCVFPPDHLQQHLRARRPGLARTGDSYRLEREVSGRVDDAAIRSGAFVHWVSRNERWRLRRRWLREVVYSTFRHSRKPKLMAGNLAVWRSDFERVNGFDEQFMGWGCEDDDLGLRLRQAGVRIAPIFGYTQGYHLWHLAHPSRPKKWREGANVEYLARRDKPTRCVHGLSSHARREAA